MSSSFLPVYKDTIRVYVLNGNPPEMNLIEDIEVICPYCGSSFTIEADTEEGSYSTIEDCEICCRPIAVSIRCRPGKVEAVEAEPG